MPTLPARPRDTGALLTVRALTLISVLLALMCAGLAAAWSREHAKANCWRSLVEDDEIPPQGDCRR